MKVEVKGFRELEKALAEELPKATAKNALRRAMVATMKSHIEEPAKQLAPRERGTLEKGITTKSAKAKRTSRTRYARSTGLTVETGPTGRPEGGNAAWQEFGTVKMPPHPYMRPAADSGGQKVIDDIRDNLKAEIDKAKARIARKAARGK
jgi:HK97 gp10 family phage protein